MATPGSPTMTPVDALFEAFCSSLPADLRDRARALPFRLGLAPVPGVGFGAVFRHEVTLGAPRMVAEGLPGCPPGPVQRASLAHVLAVVEAFGVDRIEDGQVARDASLCAVLDHVREARDHALGALAGEEGLRLARAADRATREAIAEERVILSGRRSVPVETYLDVSARKQAVGIVSSEALCLSVGCSPATVQAVGRCLLGIALGLQLVDDARDWEDDLAQGGGAWAAVLAAGVPEGLEPVDHARGRIHRTATLARLVGLARTQILDAGGLARDLGATRLSGWAHAQADEWAELLTAELRGPGHVVRRKKLAAWAAEVLA